MPLSASYRPLQPDNSIRFNFCVLYAALTIIPNNKEIIMIIIDQHLVQNSAIILDNVGFKILKTLPKIFMLILPLTLHLKVYSELSTYLMHLPVKQCILKFYSKGTCLQSVVVD